MASPPFDMTDRDRISPELWRLLGRAVMLTDVSDETEDVQINFSTLLLAFLVSDDPISRWFQEYVRVAGVHAERIYGSKSIEPGVLDRIRKDEAPEKHLYEIKEVSYSTGQVLRQAIGLAERLASRAGNPAQQGVQYQDESEDARLDVRHVMGALIYYPLGHEEQLAGWGFERLDWATSFLQALASIHPEERYAWRDIHAEVFGAPPEALPEDAPPGGSAELSPLPALAERLAGYDSDRATGDRAHDLLNITPDVNALASLIAAKSTLPSLAIGIFGDWGSGKTFFMRSLMRRVDRLSASARGLTVDDRQERPPEQLQKEITFYKRIVQIEFNAWHYVEGNLWASLVEHIFKNLRISQDASWDPDGRRLDTLQAHLLAEIQRAEAEEVLAEQQVEEARRRLTEAGVALEQLVREREAKQRELATLTVWDVLADEDREPVLAQVNGALEAAGLPEAGESLREIEAALREGRAVLQRGGALAAPLLRAGDRRRRVWLLFVSLVAGPAIGLLASLIAWSMARGAGQEFLARVSGVALGSATFLGSVANWLRSQVKWTSDRLAALERASQRLEKLQAEKLALYDLKIAALKGDVKNLDKKYVEAQERVNAARRKVQEIEEQLRQATPARRLARFIQERTDSDDYRKHLGLLALVRRDFEVLSEYIEGQNALLEGLDSLDQEHENAALRINRIVLYIDDLDRCPPDKVVQVLQAVHLLLAFPLFVVVVGVDARWVSHALEQHYPHLRRDAEQECLDGDPLDFGRDATPHDYLEKIFQIPIWLHPIGERGSCQMLNGLLEDEVVPDAPAQVAPGPDDQPPADRPPAPAEAEEAGPAAETLPAAGESAPAPDEEPSPPAAEGTEAEGAGAEGQEEAELPIDLTPESLRIYASELAFMRELAGIVGRSPRAVKRFVNLYRLLKATLEQTDEPLEIGAWRRIGDILAPSDQEVVLFLLAVVTGLPDISRRFFEVIREGTEQNEAGFDPAHELDWALDQLGQRVTGIRAAEADLGRLRTWLKGYREGAWLDVLVDHLNRRAAQVARYSFRVEQR